MLILIGFVFHKTNAQNPNSNFFTSSPWQHCSNAKDGFIEEVYLTPLTVIVMKNNGKFITTSLKNFSCGLNYHPLNAILFKLQPILETPSLI